VYLFEQIDAQTKYDELKLQKKLLAKKIKTPLPVLKNYVQELLLKALRFYHADNSIDNLLRNYLHDSELLHNKGLDKSRDKVLRRAKTLAKTHEKKEMLLDILNKEWQYKSIFNPKKIEQDHEIALDDLSKLLNVRTLVYNVSTLLGKGEIRDDTLQKEWDDAIQGPSMVNILPHSGYEENCHYHHNWMRYYHRTNDFEKCCMHQELLIKHMESRQDLLVDYKMLYIFELNGLVVAYCQKSDFDKAKAVIDKLIRLEKIGLNIPEKTTLIDTISIAYGNLIHGYYLFDFDSVVQTAIDAEKFLKTKNATPHHAAFLYLNLAKTSIYTGQYRNALVWTNLIFDDSPENRRDDFYVLAWIFNLIIHYELDHIDLLPSLIRSTTRFLQKRKRLYKTESAIMAFLNNKLPKTNSKKEVLLFFNELKIELEEIIKDPYEAKAFKYFDFIAWLQSKIENKSVIAIISSKSHKN